MFSNDIRLHVYTRSRLQVAQSRMTQGVLDQRKLQTARLELVHRETDAIDGDGSMQREERLNRWRKRDVDQQRIASPLNGCDNTHAINVALYYVSAESVAGPERTLDIDPRSLLSVANRRLLYSSAAGDELKGVDLGARSDF